MFVENAILIAFAVTILSESAVVFFFRKPFKLKQWLLITLLANSITHPLVIYFYQVRSIPIVLVELTVLMAEAVMYNLAFTIGWKRALILSGLANAASVVTGIIIRSFV